MEMDEKIRIRIETLEEIAEAYGLKEEIEKLAELKKNENCSEKEISEIEREIREKKKELK